MKFSRLFFIFVFLLLVLPTVFSLGITPGRVTLDYKDNMEKIVEVSLLNNNMENMDVVLSVEGELKDFILLSKNKISFTMNDSIKSFKYTVVLPNDLGPGLHKAEIIALKVPDILEGENSVGATVAVVTQIYVYVPCPGKCIDADLEVLNMEQNETALFIVPVISRGKVGIQEVRANIEVYGPLNDFLDSFDTNYLSLAPGRRIELFSKWDVNVNPGEYIAKVNVFYDGNVQSFEKRFQVGINLLSLENIIVNGFRLGEIAKFQLLIKNSWNKELKDVFANLIVYNKEGEQMVNVKSPSEDIPALSKEELTLYWDTAGVNKGDYDSKLIIDYEEGSLEKELVLKVRENDLKIVGVGYAIRAFKLGNYVNTTVILIIIVCLLILFNISWLIRFRRFRRHSKR